jgi:hypothetical protein
MCCVVLWGVVELWCVAWCCGVLEGIVVCCDVVVTRRGRGCVGLGSETIFIRKSTQETPEAKLEFHSRSIVYCFRYCLYSLMQCTASCTKLPNAGQLRHVSASCSCHEPRHLGCLLSLPRKASSRNLQLLLYVAASVTDSGSYSILPPYCFRWLVVRVTAS